MMICPNPECLAENETTVRDTDSSHGFAVVRLRRCKKCGAVIETAEVVTEWHMPVTRDRASSLAEALHLKE